MKKRFCRVSVAVGSIIPCVHAVHAEWELGSPISVEVQIVDNFT